MARVGRLLMEEQWGWRVAGADGERWDFELGRSVRRFREVSDVEDYWRRCENIDSSTVRASSFSEEPSLPAPARLFISHATEDLAVATLFRDALLNAGVREEHIFYSGDRSTGVPTGTDIRSYLLAELRSPGLVVELLSPSFVNSSWCLLEVGAAWGLEKPTYPIVVPPLTVQEAASVVGDVQMGGLDTDQHVRAVFDELHERLASDLDIVVKATSWRRAVETFTRGLKSALLPVPSRSPRPGRTASEGDIVSKLGVQVTGCVILEGAFGREVSGEASNVATAERTAVIKATFFDADRRIVGTAEGVVNQLAPGETQTFTLSSIRPIPDHAEMKIQLDTVY